jgi:predicted PurR-regulated permease PerM
MIIIFLFIIIVLLLVVIVLQTTLGSSFMALNAEVKAYADRVSAAVANISEDIKRILANQTTVLSDEDRATLEAAVAGAEALAAQNPEP